LRIVIDGYGKFIGKRDNQIVVKENGHELDYFLAEELSQVIVTGKGSVGFDALKLLAQNQVDLVVLNWTGDIIYRLSPPELKNVEARREQYSAYQDIRSGFLCKEIIRAKIENQRAVLRSLARSREKNNADLSFRLIKHRDVISEYVNRLNNMVDMPVEDLRGEIFGLEGQSSIEYWKGISLVINPDFGFKSRSGRGAQDGVNALLNYGYGLLRGEVWRAVHLSALDPYAGYLHADRWGRPSLVFDLMEEFRQQIVDRSVLKLINRRQIKADAFTVEDGLCRILDKDRRTLIAQILKRLDSTIKINRRKIKWSSLIIRQARLLAKYLTGKAEYRGFYLR